MSRYVRMSSTPTTAPHVVGICVLPLEATAGRRLPAVSSAQLVRRAVIASAGGGLVDAGCAIPLVRGRSAAAL